MWKLITVVVVKLLISVLRLIGRHATALPGLVAERMHPHLLRRMIADIEGGTIMVTGTNGKTTTSKLLRKILKSQGRRVLANSSGSNFTRGILTSLIDHADWLGRLNYDIAVLEVDEAYTPLIAAEIKPRIITVLNVMRDQLDRYGEIDNTVSMIGQAVKHSESLVVNIDDPPLEALIENVDKTTTYGASKAIHRLLPSDDELHAEQVSNQSPKHTADALLLGYEVADDANRLSIQLAKQKVQVVTGLDGVHNFLNITAALATLYQLDGQVDAASIAAIHEIKPAFGRGERMEVEGATAHLALVKNPSGFNQNVRSFVTPRVGGVLFIINDKIADGRDVSWLWDVDLDPIVKAKHLRLFCSGIRAYDMALRLAHEGLKVDLIEPKINRGLEVALRVLPKDKELLILPTYTAMLEARKVVLKKQRGESWR